MLGVVMLMAVLVVVLLHMCTILVFLPSYMQHGQIQLTVILSKVPVRPVQQICKPVFPWCHNFAGNVVWWDWGGWDCVDE